LRRQPVGGVTEDTWWREFGRPLHVGITTRDLQEALGTLGARLDLQWTEVNTDRVPGLSTPDGPSAWYAHRAHSMYGPLHYEVFQGSPGSTWATDEALVRHHLAYWSRDVTVDSARLVAEGWTLELFIADEDGRPTDFAYLIAPGTEDPGRVELVDIRRQPSYFELVQHTDHG
jgi:hypothetical protein